MIEASELIIGARQTREEGFARCFRVGLDEIRPRRALG